LRSNASYFSFQYPLVSLRPSSSCLRLLRCLHVTSILPSIFRSITCFKAVSTQDVPNSVSLPTFYCMHDIPVLLECMSYFFISHTIGPTDPFHPFPAPNFKTFQVFLIYSPKCLCISTIKRYAPNVVLYVSSRNLGSVAW
jgi:hypothetical protein